MKYYVLNENTLVYTDKPINPPMIVGVLQGDVWKGGHHWFNGPITITESDTLRPATKDDFNAFRVDSTGHLE